MKRRCQRRFFVLLTSCCLTNFLYAGNQALLEYFG